MSQAQHHARDTYPRRVLFVAGAGRSGTSTMAGLLQRLGLTVPPPEVAADDSNPKGFAEPAWTVAFHDRLLAEARVQVSDARPTAWFDTGKVALKQANTTAAADWLGEHLATNPELVIKDPRLSWFISMWKVAALRNDAGAAFVTMLRPPSEVVVSKEKYYDNRLGSAHLAAGWLNMLLHTELATRDSGRVFVRYADLLEDWTRVVMALGETLEIQHVLHADSEDIRECHRFVDPHLRRMTMDLADLKLPKRLHQLVEATWSTLNELVEDDSAAHRETLDQLREEYVELYAESEAISRSSVVAATLAQRRRPIPEPGLPAPAPQGSRGFLADRIPHDLRAKIPPGVRQGVRRAIGRER